MDFLQQPIEALYTATILAGRGHEADVVDLRVESIEDIVRGTPDLFVLITQTYDLTQCYSISIRRPAEVVAGLRESYPGIPVVAVGLHASMKPEMTKQELGCDLALQGELEIAVPWLIDRLAENPGALSEPLGEVPATVDPVDLPVPDYTRIKPERYWSEILDPQTQTISRGKTGLLLANRGCPYSCTYCFVWFGQKIRQRKPSQVVAEMRAQTEIGVKHFFFLDYTFTISKPWVRELCQLLVEADLDVSWICQTRCERVDLELLREMRRAGCSGVYYGVESPWIGETSMEKPTSRELIENTIQTTLDAGLHPLVFILFGTENNDPAKAEELFQWLKSLPGTFLTSALLPRPFTSLWDAHTKDREPPASWNEYAEIADDLSRNVFSSPAMREIQAQIHELPNYLGNRPRV